MIKSLFAILIVIILGILTHSARLFAAPQVIPIIPAGANWAYLDDGTNQGTAWRAINFDDSSWDDGPAELGYGDSDEATVVSYGPNATNKYITTYFRHKFVVNDPVNITALTLSLQRDDGAIVYLNGTEVVRSNMPAGSVNHLTLASATVSGANEDAFFDYVVSPALLVSGENVTAVEIHQRSNTSTDISFNLSLNADVDDTQPPTTPMNLAAIDSTAYSITLAWDNSTDDIFVAGYEIFRDNNLVGTSVTPSFIDNGLIPETNYTYTVRALDGAGNYSSHSNPVAHATDAIAASIRFGVIGDFGDSGVPEADVAALVNSWRPDFVTTVGDNNYPDGEAATVDANIGQYYQSFIGAYTGSYGSGSAINRFFPALGNHDWRSISCAGTNCTGPHFDYFDLPNNERYYTQVWGPVELFIIDSDSHEPDGILSNSTQATWLQAQLAASTATWKLVLMHHAPYSSASHGSNANLQWPYDAWGADAVIAGHDHTYERFLINNFPYFVNGLGGRSLYGFNATQPGSVVRYNNDYGAMIVEADDLDMTFQFLNRTGTVIDCYSIGSSASPSSPTAVAKKLSATNLQLSWTIAAANPGYEVHRSTTPYFVPNGLTLISQTPLVGASSYIDLGSIGDSALNHYYVVRALDCGGSQTADSHWVGEFDFAIEPGS